MSWPGVLAVAFFQLLVGIVIGQMRGVRGRVELMKKIEIATELLSEDRLESFDAAFARKRAAIEESAKRLRGVA